MVFLERHLPALDGILVISSALQDYVTERTSVPTQLLGPIVDTTVNTPLPPLHLTGSFIVGYAGSLSQEKDGVLNLLKAVAEAAPQLAPRSRYESRSSATSIRQQDDLLYWRPNCSALVGM